MKHLLAKKSPTYTSGWRPTGEGQLDEQLRPRSAGCGLTCWGQCRYSCGGCWTDSCVGHCSSFCGRVSW